MIKYNHNPVQPLPIEEAGTTKSNKAPGIYFSCKLLKTKNKLFSMIQSFIKEIWQEEQFQGDWDKSIIMPSL